MNRLISEIIAFFIYFIEQSVLQLHKVTENWDCIKLLFNFSGKYKRLYKKNCRRFSKFSDKVKSDKENETKQLLVYATDFCINKLWNSLIK